MAYEPDPEAVAALQRNLDHNNIRNVTVVPFPATRDGRDVTFTRTAGGGGSNIHGCGEGPVVRMPSRTPDTAGLEQAQRLLVKMDCEGSEGELSEWIAEHADQLPARLRVVGEYHPWCPKSAEEMTRCLQKAGFHVTWGDRFGEKYFDASRQWGENNH